MELPDFFIAKMREFFPDEADLYFESLNERAYCGIRANTLKIKASELPVLLGFPPNKVGWCDEGFYYTDVLRPAKSPFYHAGLFYIQEPSAMSAASVFDVKPDEAVLDICAAPGGKTTQLAAKLNGQGVIVANDASNTRCRALVKNIELMGITNAVVLNETPERLAGRFAGFFDKILIDAPCSGEGMFRKDQGALKNYTKYKSDQLSAAQKNILRHADVMLKTGGEIMYCTCTFAPDENEKIIGWFLDTHKGYQVVPIDKKYGFDDGKAEAYTPRVNELKYTARIWPHKLMGEGHFLARLKKTGADPLAEEQADFHTKHGKKPNCAGKFVSDYTKMPNYAGKPALDYSKKPYGAELFAKFCEEHLNKSWSGANLARHGDSLYEIPALLPNLTGLRIIRMGFYLGNIKKDRFELSQALAMSLKKNDAKRVLDYTEHDDELYRYLKGESFDSGSPVSDGFALVCVRGYPVGFGKVQNGRLKNRYQKSWVMN